MNLNKLGRILVVDDDDWILSLASVVLNDAGFEVDLARNGNEGLEAALREEPDLIITDVLMPELDGWDFVRQLRAHSRFALVPVFFLTCKGSAQDRIAGFQLGADDYLGKPVNFAELPRRVGKALIHRRRLEQELHVPSITGKGLQGTLDQIGMATLLGVLSAGGRSGILQLSGGALREDLLIYLVRGQIHRVELQGRGRLTNEEVLQQLFRWLEGAFEFAPMNLRLPDEMNLPMNRLLMRGASRISA